MAAQTFLDRVAGKLKQITAILTSAGAADSGKIAGLDAGGRFDLSFMPTGLGPETITLPTSENLAAGDIVHIYDAAGAATARKADASAASLGKTAHGFVIAATTSPANAVVYMPSQQDAQVTGLTPGIEYYLSDTPGGVTAAPGPTTSGHASQLVGIASAAGNLLFNPEPAVQLA